MRDFRVRHTNRGESGKTSSRKANAKFASGVTDLGPEAVINDDALLAEAGASREDEADAEDEARFRSASNRRERSRQRKSKLSRGFGGATNEAELEGGPIDAATPADDNTALDNDDDDYHKDGTSTPPAQWQSSLREAIDSLVDRKKAKANKTMREKYIATITYVLRHVYAAEEIQSQLPELVPALLKSIKTDAEADQREAQLALEALTVLTVTLDSSASQAVFAASYKPLRRRLLTAPSNTTKAWLVIAIGVLSYYGRVPNRTLVESVLPFLSEIVSTDGKSAGARDSGEVVAAAEQMWTFVATRTGVARDSGAVTEAVEAFLDQLESTVPDVQITAGEGIVTIYEMTYARKAEEGEEIDHYDSDFDDGDDELEYRVEGDDDADKKIEAGLKASKPTAADYDDPAVLQCKKHFAQVFPPLPAHQFSQLLESVKQVSRTSAKNVSGESRRRLRSSFSDFYNSLSRHPILGPRYQTSVDWETGQERGSRATITIGTRELLIRHWWQWTRWQVLRLVLHNGVSVHYMARNGNVLDSLNKPPPTARAWSKPAEEEDEEDGLYEGDENDDSDDE